MSKKRLSESYEAAFASMVSGTDTDIERFVEQWGEVPYPELAVILVRLRHLYLLHQTHHWMSVGQASYADHLMFQRLYELTLGEIDDVAEKAVGLGCEKCVNLSVQVMQLAKLCTSNVGLAGHTPEAMIGDSLTAELAFIKDVASLADRLRSRGNLTRGLDNLLAGIEDDHEGSVFLLKQRLKRESL